MRRRKQGILCGRKQKENERLDVIERKLSHIEHRLDDIEERSLEVQDDNQNDAWEVRINNKVGIAEIRSDMSAESGIEEGSPGEDDEEPKEEATVQKRRETREEWDGIDPYPSEVSEKDGGGECSVSKVEILNRERDVESLDGIQAWDIISHGQTTASDETMMKLLQGYPTTHLQARPAYENNDYQSANEFTLGVPRNVRDEKRKSAKRRQGTACLEETEIVGNSVPLSCRYCKCAIKSGQQKDNNVCFPGNEKKEHMVHSFPTRKTRVKSASNPPAVCECRLDQCRDSRMKPPLQVTGTQVPLCDRESLLT